MKKANLNYVQKYVKTSIYRNIMPSGGDINFFQRDTVYIVEN